MKLGAERLRWIVSFNAGQVACQNFPSFIRAVQQKMYPRPRLAIVARCHRRLIPDSFKFHETRSPGKYEPRIEFRSTEMRIPGCSLFASDFEVLSQSFIEPQRQKRQ